MRRLVLLLALCLLPSFAIAFRPFTNPLIVRGRVYCDTCRAGFETPATTYIAGARVRLECRDRHSFELRYTIDALTNAFGTYEVTVNEDHEDKVYAMQFSSEVQDLIVHALLLSPGRDRVCVILTRYNGIASDISFVNSLGFMKDEALSGCTELLQQYSELND